MIAALIAIAVVGLAVSGLALCKMSAEAEYRARRMHEQEQWRSYMLERYGCHMTAEEAEELMNARWD